MTLFKIDFFEFQGRFFMKIDIRINRGNHFFDFGGRFSIKTEIAWVSWRRFGGTLRDPGDVLIVLEASLKPLEGLGESWLAFPRFRWLRQGRCVNQ